MRREHMRMAEWKKKNDIDGEQDPIRFSRQIFSSIYDPTTVEVLAERANRRIRNVSYVKKKPAPLWKAQTAKNCVCDCVNFKALSCLKVVSAG